MKKIVSLFMVVAMVMASCFALSSCGSSKDEQGAADGKTLKIGAILVGDENEGYTYAHIEGIKKAASELGIKDDQIIWKYSIKEDETCYDAAADLADQGCNLIVSNSYGHQSYMEKAAGDYPDVQFVSMTGDTASKSGLCKRFHKHLRSTLHLRCCCRYEGCRA